MLRATRVGVFSPAYDITIDGRTVTRWDKSMWRTGGSFTVEGRRYEVRGNLWGSTYTLIDESGSPVATAANPNRRQWSVAAGGQTFEFRWRSWWRQQYDLVAGGQAVGFVRRPSGWRSTAVAELPTMPLAIQVFAVAIAVTTWDAAAAAVASA